MTRKTLLLAGAGLVAAALIAQAHPVTPRPRPSPTATEAPAPDLTASRRAFAGYCEDGARAALTQPATFDPSYFGSGLPQLVQWPDHTQSWTWTLSFRAANALGAVGRYEAHCGQDPDGTVHATVLAAR